MGNKIVKYVFYLLSATGLILASEFVYTLRNKPSHLAVPFYVLLARTALEQSDVQGTLNYLNKAAVFNLKDIAQYYPGFSLPTSVNTPILPINNQLRSSFLNYQRKVDYSKLSERNTGQWALTYYSLGLLAYRYGEPDLASKLWQIAVNSAPEFSFTYVELANYYLTINQASSAATLLNECSRFTGPQAHCNQFMKQNVQTNSPSFIGFMEQPILNYLK